MRVLQVHNRYSQAGGEDAVVDLESQLLRRQGHQVEQFIVSNNEIRTVQWLGVGWRCGRNRIAMNAIDREIRSIRPDIVHVHNFFPLLSTSVYAPCARHNTAVVQTLHNYRPICLGATFCRNGTVCEKCLGGNPAHGVLHRCYRGSLAASAAGAWMIMTNSQRRTWHEGVDRFIAPSEFVKSKFIAAGFPANRIAVKTNFVSGLWATPVPERDREGGLFVGRLSEEKGFKTVVAAIQQAGAGIRVVGDGPLKASCNGTSAIMVGQLPAEGVRDEMLAAQYLVVPSVCYEGWPVVIAEAFSSGLPVIASRIGALAEIVEDGKTGLLFEPGNAADLVTRLKWASTHRDEMARMGRNARLVYEGRLTAECNYKDLVAIYRAAIADPCCDRAANARQHS